jgi:hypothetical protein
MTDGGVFCLHTLSSHCLPGLDCWLLAVGRKKKQARIPDGKQTTPTKTSALQRGSNGSVSERSFREVMGQN